MIWRKKGRPRRGVHAEGLGLEPRFVGPEPTVLPLNDPSMAGEAAASVPDGIKVVWSALLSIINYINNFNLFIEPI